MTPCRLHEAVIEVLVLRDELGVLLAIASSLAIIAVTSLCDATVAVLAVLIEVVVQDFSALTFLAVVLRAAGPARGSWGSVDRTGLTLP